MAGKDADSNSSSPDNSLPPTKTLPTSLQEIVDRADSDRNFYDQVVQGSAPESTESNVRYAGYAARIRTALLSAHRYVAYTSDVGESFRPVAHPILVTAAYGISWAYLIGDCAHEGYKAYLRNQKVLHPTPEAVADATAASSATTATAAAATPATSVTKPTIPPLEDFRTVMFQRAVFQSIASMGLPAFTIHSVVRYSGRALKNAKSTMIRTWAPIGLGLSVVPFLPYLFDKPVEEAVEWTFHKAFETLASQSAQHRVTKEKEA